MFNVHVICFPILSTPAVLPCSLRVYPRMKNSDMCGAPCIYSISYNIPIHIGFPSEGYFRYDQCCNLRQWIWFDQLELQNWVNIEYWFVPLQLGWWLFWNQPVTYRTSGISIPCSTTIRESFSTIPSYTMYNICALLLLSLRFEGVVYSVGGYNKYFSRGHT